MPTVRIFVPTYRRAKLLERALASVQAQTFSDWVCEVHNDDPKDDAPGKLLKKLGDARFRLVTHERNLGGTATFNLFFKATSEPFYTMLEDDNWWEPEFLSQMLLAAEAHPTATLVWANMRLWKELPDGRFQDTGQTVWPQANNKYRSFEWGDPLQMCGALHSHGAALLRSRRGDDFATPDVPIAAVEPFRERALPHPLVLVTEPLANFSLTLRSARTQDHAEWGELQTALAATFLRFVQLDEGIHKKLWAAARCKEPPTSSTFINAALVEPACRGYLRHSRASDWFRWIRGTVHRPRATWRILHSKKLHPQWWHFLEHHTAERSQRHRIN